MNYKYIVQMNIDYIENNLKADISADELAGHAGFSLFHYYRIFQQFTGMPVMQYIVRRRLAHAIYEVQCGRKMIDAAMDYGFNTHAGFYKAFQREYDCSPTEYLRYAPARQPQKINLMQEDFVIMTHAKLKEIVRNWDIEQPVVITDVFLGGNNNIKAEDTWNVNNQYVIKAVANLGSLNKHFALSKAIKDAGLEAAHPIPDRKGKNYVFEDGRYFFLSSKFYGNRLHSKECFTGDYKSKARYLGECVGQLHKILAKCDDDFPLNEANLNNDVMKWALPSAKEQMLQYGHPLLESFYDDYISTFSRLSNDLPRQVIHRNICPSNFIMTDGKLTGFVDFELSERNIRLFDPCYCATGILSESINENNPEKLEKWPDIFKNILIGYDSVCNLTPEEREAAIYVVYSIQMICVAYFGNLDKFVELAGINRRMLTWIYENRERLTAPL